MYLKDYGDYVDLRKLKLWLGAVPQIFVGQMWSRGYPQDSQCPHHLGHRGRAGRKTIPKTPIGHTDMITYYLN